jgi:hypothetical protein
MTMLPQPPPNAPAPPPSKEALRSQRWWRWIWVVGLLSIVGLILLGLSAPLVLRSRKKTDQTEAVNNARQIGMALYEFEAEYGKFPDATTIAEVRKKTGSLLPLQMKTSNDFFRQLIAAGIVQSEVIFYAKISGCKKPSMWSVPSEDLAKSECGFSYLAGQSSSGNPSRPLVVTPLIPGTDRFDPKRFNGKAIILRMDNSVTSLPIQRDGHVMYNGMNLLDPANPVWGGEKFTIAWPDL